jgi:deoxyribonuclease IV
VGSHRGSGVEIGRERVVKGVQAALDGMETPFTLLLENSVGAGDQLAGNAEDLAFLMSALHALDLPAGICLDTAHLWGAGYDLSSAAATRETFEYFASLVGVGQLRLIHANDSTHVLASHRDEHALPGTAQIGRAAFDAIRETPSLAAIPLIVEAPEEPPEILRQILDFLRGEAPVRGNTIQ